MWLPERGSLHTVVLFTPGNPDPRLSPGGGMPARAVERDRQMHRSYSVPWEPGHRTF